MVLVFGLHEVCLECLRLARKKAKLLSQKFKKSIQTSRDLNEVVSTLKEQTHQLRELRRLLPECARETYFAWKEKIQKELPLTLLNSSSFDPAFIRPFAEGLD